MILPTVPHATSAQNTQPLLNGLVAAYGFDEGSGTSTSDASGHGNTGTITNATWSTVGKFGSSLAFRGADWVTITHAASLDLGSQMTLEAWVYPLADDGWRTVLLKESENGLRYGLYATSDTATPVGAVEVAGYGYVETRSPGPLPLSTWTHLAVTYDGAIITLYENGVVVGSTSQSGTALDTSDAPLRIGGNAVWGEYFYGRIDNVRVYNRALPRTDIQAAMLTPVGSNTPTPTPTVTTDPYPAPVTPTPLPPATPTVAPYPAPGARLGNPNARSDVSSAMQSTRAFLPLLTRPAPPDENPAPPVPRVVNSYYMQTTNVTVTYNTGFALGQADATTSGTQKSVAILMYGQPYSYSTTLSGTVLYDDALTVASTIEISGSLRAFARGYYAGIGTDTQSNVIVAAGVSNLSSQANAAHGRAWARLVNDYRTWVRTQGYGAQVTVAGANDIEMGFNSARQTRAWVQAFAQTIGVGTYLYYFGDAAGCPEDTQSETARCDNGWLQRDVWDIAWGDPDFSVAFPFPQIYRTNGAMARQWYRLVKYGVTFRSEVGNAKMIIQGVLTQAEACNQKEGTPRQCDDTVKNTPAQAWSQLWLALNADSQTGQTPRYASDIRYSRLNP